MNVSGSEWETVGFFPLVRSSTPLHTGRRCLAVVPGFAPLGTSPIRYANEEQASAEAEDRARRVGSFIVLCHLQRVLQVTCRSMTVAVVHAQIVAYQSCCCFKPRMVKSPNTRVLTTADCCGSITLVSSKAAEKLCGRRLYQQAKVASYACKRIRDSVRWSLRYGSARTNTRTRTRGDHVSRQSRRYSVYIQTCCAVYVLV